MRMDSNSQFVVEDLFLFEIENVDDAMRIFNQGVRNKIVSSHKLNHASSRSHVIFTFQVDFQDA